jgi:hypothetical protein
LLRAHWNFSRDPDIDRAQNIRIHERVKNQAFQSFGRCKDDPGEGSVEEKRTASRHRVLKAGNILFGGGAIDCTVRNLSQTGAALDVASPMGIPENIKLLIPADGKQFDCRVVWRKERRIGVMFVQAAPIPH